MIKLYKENDVMIEIMGKNKYIILQNLDMQ